jgi:hypothetical protein
MTKAEARALGPLLIVGLIILTISKVIDSVGYVAFVLSVVAAVAAVFLYFARTRQNRLEHLRQKYKDETVVRQIMAHRFWQGQTSEQLLDSLGKPLSVDQNIFKARDRDIWKYDRRGTNRFGLRITLENGVVVGWDQKG